MDEMPAILREVRGRLPGDIPVAERDVFLAPAQLDAILPAAVVMAGILVFTAAAIAWQVLSAT